MRTPHWLAALVVGLAALVAAPADPPKADAARIAKLVKQLGSENPEEREKATKELEEIGQPAADALRAALKDPDAEVRTRAGGILDKLDHDAEGARKKAALEKLLAPTKLKLSFKDTPLDDAVAEFNKKSGYTIEVHDPDKKLVGRKATLDTGEVTFWEAFDKFCEKAELAEATWQDLRPKADAGADNAPLPPRRGPGGFGLGPGARAISVVDGKPKAAPTCYAGAVRLRALKEGPNGGGGKEDGPTVWLEFRAEPKLRLLGVDSVAVTKATDDQGQKLAAAPAGRGLGGPAAVTPGGGGGPGAGTGVVNPTFVQGPGGTQYRVIRFLRKGEKGSKALKELAGTVGASVIPPPWPIITADNITKAGGKTFQGTDGGALRVLSAKEEDGKLTLQFELDQPLGYVPEPPGTIPLLPPPTGGKPADGKPPELIRAAPGVSLLDDGGKAIAPTGADRTKWQFVPGGVRKGTFTQEYKLDKGRKPAKLVYSATRAAGIEVPFSFKDVPLR